MEYRYTREYILYIFIYTLYSIKHIYMIHLPTRSLLGPTSIEFQLNEYLEGQFV